MHKDKRFALTPLAFLSILTALVLTSSGCSVQGSIDDLVAPQSETAPSDASAYYTKFYKKVTMRAKEKKGTTKLKALDSLPKDPAGEVNWTAAVVDEYISPLGSLDPNVEDDPPLDMNVFIEAKAPLIYNVVFPHSIHTYWLKCDTCHPQMFLPEAGANNITMDGIFNGEWCGRCHGKVAFTFWPRVNCLRCHIVPKGKSLTKEKWR